MKPLLFSLVFLLGSLSFAQLRYKGEVALAVNPAVVSVNKSTAGTFGFSLRAHLEMDYELEPLDFRLVLDPAVNLADSNPENALVQPGVTESFARYDIGNTELSGGIERLPLETARLSIPFSPEPVGALGQPLGLLGARATLFTRDWRIRPAFVYRLQDEQFGAVLSVRREFSSFDLEAHILYLNGFAAGLGGSGLLGDIVVYGEAWLLSNPWDIRGALGLSGYWGDLLWTTELAYAADPLDTDLELGELAPNAYVQLLGQLSLPQGSTGTFDLNTSFGFVDSAVANSGAAQILGNLSYTYLERDYQLVVGPTFSRADLATLYGLQLSVTTFF